ncbi:mannose 6-phosphate receptor domain-containing protein [Guyanagaster necrorhizus]|uniref:Autophagy-related protein 27 n=1 Tax=Guyanagaster necrorhizus TaxID=856835 RepID=A0A9P8AV49_9AGAR|nr:mannose 6-phosphate receptor domain-containing protein [Guyanagaster necrorhizus MCA 3950]KAG7447562.1 mannose 6-phosphate receptor domain-containing protein [Guyanagaster necrorhizus MCA 3950]
MKAPLLLSILSLSYSILAVVADERPCTIHASNGDYFDLNPLKASKDYTFSSPGGKEFRINVCRSVASETWGLDDPDVGGVVRRDHGDFSLGKTNTTLDLSPENIVRIVLTSGSRCNSQYTANTVIEFICDTAVFGAGAPKLLAQLPQGDDEACAFFVEWRTHACPTTFSFACPTGERSGPWGFFASLIVIILVLLMLYLTLGTLHNRYVLRLHGFDQIPQFNVDSMRYHLKEGLDLFKDWMAGMYEGGQGAGWSRSSQGGAGGFSGRTNPVSHQSGVDTGDGDGGFVRPPRNGTAAKTNPVSHQSQVQKLSSQPQPDLQSRQYQKKKEEGTAEERAPFMLGEDDEDDDVTNAPPTQPSSFTPAVSVAPLESTATSIQPAVESANNAAAFRGRDLGSGRVTRL